jgi:hypothetical protein
MAAEQRGSVGKRLGVFSAALALVALAVEAVSPALGSSGDEDNGADASRDRHHHGGRRLTSAPADFSLERAHDLVDSLAE